MSQRPSNVPTYGRKRGDMRAHVGVGAHSAQSELLMCRGTTHKAMHPSGYTDARH